MHIYVGHVRKFIAYKRLKRNGSTRENKYEVSFPNNLILNVCRVHIYFSIKRNITLRKNCFGKIYGLLKLPISWIWHQYHSTVWKLFKILQKFSFCIVVNIKAINIILTSETYLLFLEKDVGQTTPFIVIYGKICLL